MGKEKQGQGAQDARFEEFFRTGMGQVADLFAPFTQKPILPGTPDEMGDWSDNIHRLQAMWVDFQQHQLGHFSPNAPFMDPMQWLGFLRGW